jgi:hypothetical protein
MFADEDSYSNFTAVSERAEKTLKTISKPVDKKIVELKEKQRILNEKLKKIVDESQSKYLDNIIKKFPIKTLITLSGTIEGETKLMDQVSIHMLANFPYHWPNKIQSHFLEWLNQNRALVGLKPLQLPPSPKQTTSNGIKVIPTPIKKSSAPTNPKILTSSKPLKGNGSSLDTATVNPTTNSNQMWFIGGGVIALILLVLYLSSRPKQTNSNLTAFGRRLAKISRRR